MDRFLEKFNVPRLNQEEIKIMNNAITSTKTEVVIKKISPKTKAQDHMASQIEFYQTFGEELMPILKHFQKIAEEGTLSNPFYEATIILIPKPDKNNTKKKTTGQYH